MLTKAKMIEMVPAMFELSLMSSSVTVRVFYIPSTIDSSPFWIIKYRSCYMSLIGVPLCKASLYQKEILGTAVPIGNPSPPLAPFLKAAIFRILDEKRFSEVYSDYVISLISPSVLTSLTRIIRLSSYIKSFRSVCMWFWMLSNKDDA